MAALSTRPSPIAVLPALLLISVSLWEVCASRRDANATPDDAAWERAAQVVRAEYRPGDLIVFAPEWVDPVGRLHVGDLISLEAAGRMDAARYGRIWELSIRGAHAAEVDGLEPVSATDRDGVRVRRYERAPVTVLADVRDQLATAKIESAGQSGPSLELAEVGFAPHRCIQVIPQPGKPVRITFPQLALGSRLVGYVGLADVFKRRDIRAPGKLEVELDHRVIASAEPGVDDGWVRFEATTTPGIADVTFVVSAAAPERLICFAAESRQ